MIKTKNSYICYFEREPIVQKLKVKILSDLAILPKRATDGSAGYDLHAAIDDDIIIKSHQTQKINTGIALELWDNSVCAFVYARSSLACKHGITPANCVGVIDSDYRGEVIVFLTNSSDVDFTVKCGDRIAQMVLAPVITPELELSEKLNTTDRNDGGFGSTGI